MALICSYPILQVRPYGLLVYEHREFTRNTDHTRINSKSTPKTYTGKITPFSKKKLKRSIGLMVASAEWKEAPNWKTGKTFKFKVNFITFTLPSNQGKIEDKTIKICLDNWIKRAKRKHNLKSYVWRAERQVNGSIHFHMITDVWIHYQKIRDDWNACLKETGLVNRYTEKHENLTFREYLKLYPTTQRTTREARWKSYQYGRSTRWEQPNSTDVHAIWKIKNLTSYFVKYMSKTHKEGETPIQGKIWDCSSNLKTKINCSTFFQGMAEENFNYLASKEDIERIDDPMFTILFVPPEKWETYICKELREKWKEYLERIRNDTLTICEDVATA